MHKEMTIRHSFVTQVGAKFSQHQRGGGGEQGAVLAAMLSYAGVTVSNMVAGPPPPHTLIAPRGCGVLKMVPPQQESGIFKHIKPQARGGGGGAAILEQGGLKSYVETKVVSGSTPPVPPGESTLYVQCSSKLHNPAGVVNQECPPPPNR